MDADNPDQLTTDGGTFTGMPTLTEAPAKAQALALALRPTLAVAAGSSQLAERLNERFRALTASDPPRSFATSAWTALLHFEDHLTAAHHAQLVARHPLDGGGIFFHAL